MFLSLCMLPMLRCLMGDRGTRKSLSSDRPGIRNGEGSRPGNRCLLLCPRPETGSGILLGSRRGVGIGMGEGIRLENFGDGVSVSLLSEFERLVETRQPVVGLCMGRGADLVAEGEAERTAG